MAFHLPTLEPHQQAVKDFIVTHPHCGIFLSIAGGKTLSTLAALAAVRPHGHILVVAPLAIARSTWLDEVEKWSFPLRTRSLIVDENDRQLTREQRLEAFAKVWTDPPTMYFINQELLTQHSQPVPWLVPSSTAIAGSGVSDLAESIRRAMDGPGRVPSADAVGWWRDLEAAQGASPTAKTRVQAALVELKKAGLVYRTTEPCPGCKGKGCPDCSFGLVNQLPRKSVGGRQVLQWPFPTVIIDESQGFKSHTSGRFKALKAARPAILRLIELTGTPSPQSLLDLWSQMYLIDQGATLGSFAQYRARYFVPTLHVDGRPVKWEIIPGAEQAIYQAVAPFVMSATNTKLKLPPLSNDVVNVTLPADVLRAYRRFATEKALELAVPHPTNPTKLFLDAVNAAVLHGKLVQFASGTVYNAKGSHEYTVVHREKLHMLEHLVSNASGNCLVGYRFVSEKAEIVDHLTKAGHHVEVFDGSRDMVRRWNAREIEVMVVHPASAGPGLNLQHGGSTLIWFTLPDKLDQYLQLNGRLVRPGQPDPVQIWRMVAKGTKDARSPAVLIAKQAQMDGLMSAVSVDDLYMEDIEDIIGGLDINPL